MGLIQVDEQKSEDQPPRKTAHPFGDWLRVEPFDDKQTFGMIALPEDTDFERQKRRRRELQGTAEPDEVRQGKMRHARIIEVGPDCKRTKGREGQLCRFVGGVAAFYLNGEEVVFIRDENVFCWIEEPNTEPPKVLQ